MRSLQRALLTIGLGLSALGCAQGSDETDVGHGGGQKIAPAVESSCVGRCGGESEDGSCWCDPECGVSGTCCADFVAACRGGDPQGSGGGSSEWPGDAGAAGGSGSGATGGSGAGGSGAVGGAGGAASGGAGGTGSGFGGTSGSGGYGATGGSGGGATASCAGSCGGPAPGGACWCDDACQSNGDCCGDYTIQCGGAVAGGCTPQLCNTQTPAVENGLQCFCDITCHVYGDCCSNKLYVCGF